MAGSPLKRQRRKELRCIQPRIPMHQWRTLSDTEKIVAIFGMSLDEVLELMSIPFAEADLHERNLKLRIFECMMKGGLQFTRNRERANARNEILERLGAALRAPTQDDLVAWISQWMQ
jgi:hypothetical protein